MPKAKLGPIIPKPAQFKPTRTVVQNGLLYRIDDAAMAAEVVPIASGGNHSRCFRKIIKESLPRSEHRRKWFDAGSWLARLSISGLITATMLIGYPFYPQARYEIARLLALNETTASAAITAPIAETNRLLIPKIGVDTAIVEGLALDVLDRHEGVWHQTGSVAGNFVLAGHRFRYLPPNTSTFYNLDRLERGDTIAVDWFENRYTYKVVDKKTVDEKRVDVIAATNTARLTLYTCSDRRERDRIVVVAELVPPDK
jgi:LPXTG-site transpeptidase (sortase) family protein